MRPDKAQKNKKSAHSLHQTRDLGRPPVAGIFNCRRRGRHPQVCWSLLPEFRVVRVVRGSNSPSSPRQRKWDQPRNTPSTRKQWHFGFFPIPSAPGIPWFSKVFQGYPSLVKANQTTHPLHGAMTIPLQQLSVATEPSRGRVRSNPGPWTNPQNGTSAGRSGPSPGTRPDPAI